MALPVLAKTWQYAENQAVAAQGSGLATMRRVIRTSVDSMLGFASTPWMIIGSSNAVASGMDAVYRWATDADVIWSGGAHSWVVLQQTGISTTFQVCFDLNSSSSQMVVVASTAGFTGGTTSARPTAVDEVVTLNATWCSNLDITHKVNVCQASDGSATRIFVLAASTTLTTFFMFDKPVNTISGWTDPYMVTTRGISSGIPVTQLSHLSQTASFGRRTTAMALYWTGEYCGNYPLASVSSLGAVANEINSEWELYPIGLACLTTGNRGRVGSLVDIWWKAESVGHGDTFPLDGSRQFLAIGGLVVPWSGVVPQMA